MGKRGDLEPRAIDLYAGGAEIPQIAVELGVSENSLYKWRERAGTEWDDARAAFRRGLTASFEDVGKRVARAREITSQLAGDVASQSRMGQILNESLQSMIYDIMGQIQTSCLDEDSMKGVVKQINSVALTLQRTESAANLNMRRAKEIRAQALEDAAKAMEGSAREGGVSPETILKIRRDILRMAS